MHAFSRSRLLIDLEYEPCHREIYNATSLLIFALSNRNYVTNTQFASEFTS